MEFFSPSPQPITKTEASYRSGIRTAATGLWRGDLSGDSFNDAMISTIERGFEQAWTEGANQCGVGPDERTQEETDKLNELLTAEIGYLSGYREYIQQNSKAKGGMLGKVINRADLWVNRYQFVSDTARAMACADTKCIWTLGSTKEHCSTCSAMAGRVYRLSVWLANGILPRSRSLACGGHRCKCGLEETDKPITRGRFPRKR